MPTAIARLIAILATSSLVACGTTIVSSVTIEGGDRTVGLGDHVLLYAYVSTNRWLSDRSVTWNNSNESVATIVEARGLGGNVTTASKYPDGEIVVTSVTTGTTNITATSTTDPTKSDTITVTVDPITSVTIDGGDRTINLGDTLTLTATRTIEANSSLARHPVTWNSSNEAVATIDATGQVTSLTSGIATITATSIPDPTKSDTITLTIARWARHFGTDSRDEAFGIATDASGNVYATGYTDGDLEGSNAGNRDAFIRSYDSNGNLRWTRQFGTSSIDEARGIATDASGNVYTTGRTNGNLEGSNAGNSDAFIRSYDNNGNLRWTRQFGTSSWEGAFGIATDTSGNVYATGVTIGLQAPNVNSRDAFIRSYER